MAQRLTNGLSFDAARSYVLSIGGASTDATNVDHGNFSIELGCDYGIDVDFKLVDGALSGVEVKTLQSIH